MAFAVRIEGGAASSVGEGPDGMECFVGRGGELLYEPQNPHPAISAGPRNCMVFIHVPLGACADAFSANAGCDGTSGRCAEVWAVLLRGQPKYTWRRRHGALLAGLSLFRPRRLNRCQGSSPRPSTPTVAPDRGPGQRVTGRRARTRRSDIDPFPRASRRGRPRRDHGARGGLRLPPGGLRRGPHPRRQHRVPRPRRPRGLCGGAARARPAAESRRGDGRPAAAAGPRQHHQAPLADGRRLRGRRLGHRGGGGRGRAAAAAAADADGPRPRHLHHGAERLGARPSRPRPRPARRQGGPQEARPARRRGPAGHPHKGRDEGRATSTSWPSGPCSSSSAPGWPG